MFVQRVPQNHALGFRYVERAPGRMVFELPYRSELARSPVGPIHGGVVTTLIDAASGQALLTLLPGRPPIVTLDLRVDYVRASRPGATLRCEAHCHTRTAQIAWVSARVHDGDASDPVAQSVGTFMLLEGPRAPQGVM